MGSMVVILNKCELEIKCYQIKGNDNFNLKESIIENNVYRQVFFER